MGKPIIEVQNLSKRYRLGRVGATTLREDLTRLTGRFRGSRPADSERDFWALRDVSFSVEPGEVLGVIGRNGAGKSTLLKILSRITEPTSGRAVLRGRVASLLEVGTGFHQDLTGRENVFLNGAILGMKNAEINARFDEIVAFAEVEQFIDTPVKHYSSGMRVRLAFAVAAHLDSEILIADEVLAVGDAAFQQKCFSRMDAISEQGRAILFVSHELRAMESFCSRGLVMRSGKVALDAPDMRSAIEAYLGQASVNGWCSGTGDAYLNEHFRIDFFGLQTSQCTPPNLPLDPREKVWMTIEGEVLKPSPMLKLGYTLSSATGTLLYWSHHTDTGASQLPELPAGRVRLRSPVPVEVLNEGVYRAELSGSIHNRKWLFQPGVNCPAFTFEIGGLTAHGPLEVSRRAGLLSPRITWDIN